MTFRVRLVAAFVAALALVGWAAGPGLADGTASPAPSKPAGKVTFGIGPASAKDVDARPDFTLLAGRGQTLSDHVALVNLSTVPLQVQVYVADAVTGADGNVSLAARTAKPTDVAGWVTLNTPGHKATVTVPARSKVIIPFTVKVPANAEPGDHLAGLVAAITADGKPKGGGQDVKLEQRVGVRINLRVAGQVQPQLAIENLNATYAGSLNPIGKGSVVVTYTVHNIGNVKLGGQQQVSIAGLLGGATSATDLRDIPVLMPGASVDVTTVVPDVAPLFYLSTDVQVTAAAPGTDANPNVPPATATTHVWAVPWTMLALLLLLALVLVLLSRRRSTPTAGPDPVASDGQVLVPSAPQDSQ